MAPPHCYGKDDPKLVVHKADQYRSSQADKDHVHGRHPLGYLMRNCMIDAGTSVSQKFDGDQCRLQWLLDSLVEDEMANRPFRVMTWRLWLHKNQFQLLRHVNLVPPEVNQICLPIMVSDVGQAEKLCFAR